MRKNWFLNKFDIILNGLFIPLAVGLFFLASSGDVQASLGMGKQSLIQIAMLVTLVMIVADIWMCVLVAKRDWGLAWLPIVLLIRVIMIAIFALAVFFALALMAYRAKAGEERDKAVSAASRGNYATALNHARNAGNAISQSGAFGAIGGGLWGWLVRHAMSTYAG
ncbi:MAG: hypothetical protein IJ802_00845 [Kiritimatiellae bacterium]|nr:hypothetical protein [Kiritimatiellia bacterium]